MKQTIVLVAFFALGFAASAQATPACASQNGADRMADTNPVVTKAPARVRPAVGNDAAPARRTRR